MGIGASAAPPGGSVRLGRVTSHWRVPNNRTRQRRHRSVECEEMLKIYDMKGFPNPARVRIALAEKGLQEQAAFIVVNVLAGEHRQGEFLRKNPSGAVPVLELADGTCIAE